MIVYIGQSMVTAGQQLDSCMGQVCCHFAPVQHFVTLGHDGKDFVTWCFQAFLQIFQFIYKLGLEIKGLRWVMPSLLHAHMPSQVTRRLKCWIDQYSRASDLRRQAVGIKTTQRRAYQCRLGPRPISGDAQEQLEGLLG